MQLRRLSLGKKPVVLALVLVCSALAGSTAFARTGAPRNTSRPTMSGSPVVGQTLQASLGTWTGLTPITFGYSWRRCSPSGRNCADIGGANGPTYALSSNDLGATVQLAVTAINSAGSRAATSTATAVVTALSVATPPTNTAAPAITGTAEAGQSLTVSAGNWSGSAPMIYGYQWKRCDGSGSNCSDVSGATARSYTMVSADIGATVRAAVSASNSAGTASAVSAPTVTVAATPPAPDPGPPPPSAGQYWATAPLGTTGLPRADSYCAANIIRNAWEPRPQNFTANHQVPADPALVNWDTTSEPAAWLPKRALVTGNFTGTTTEIISWAACKWGLDEDTLRAVAAQESHWDQAVLGDVCGYDGQASYGLTQIKNKNCSASWIWGGYPWTKDYTALNVDLYGAAWRGCYEGNFSSWGIPGKDLWGCVGKWFSGGWFDSGANSYIASVKQHLANRTWETY